MKKINLKTEHYVLIGIILIFIGILLVFSDYFMAKKFKAYETINISTNQLPEYIEEENKDNQEELNNNQNETELTTEESENKTEQPKKTVNYNYIGYLSIPKISFKKGFTSIDSKYNDVDININVLSYSDYPDVEKGNFVVAGHSGSAWNSFFGNLYKLSINDLAYVEYNNKTYTYKIVNIYTQEKTGKIKIYRDLNKTTMTLITCTKNDKTKQTIYILEQIEVKDNE